MKTHEEVLAALKRYRCSKRRNKQGRYQLNGKPCCLIGHVLHDLGIPFPPSNGSALRVSANQRFLRKHPPLEARQLLGHVQAEADWYSPWGVVLRQFDLSVPQG